MTASFQPAGPIDPDALEQQAEEALRTGEEEQLLPSLIAAAERLRSARLWQWAGLLQRSIDEHQAALAAFHSAASLAPDDAGIARGLARVTLEAGLDARTHYEKALALGPPSSEVLLGRAAARMAVGEGELAAAEIESILAEMPYWLEGHAHLAQLQALIGRRERAYDSLERALARHPDEASFWTALFDLNLLPDDFEQLDVNVRRAMRQGIDGIGGYRAIAAGELGATAEADELFEALPPEEMEELDIWRIRHLLRSGRAGDAVPIVDRLVARDVSGVWPYAAIVWKLTGDPRAEWLDSGGSLISTFDLTDDLGDLDQLSNLLRSLHVAKSPYLDQSVRGGTQTDGPLLSRIEPEIRRLRAGLWRAIDKYLAELPPHDPAHPLLGQRRDRRIRFAGSWSVRLNGSGYHESHVHPQGWISSALYLALPQREGDPATAGWLSIGQPPEALAVEVGAPRLIEPRIAQLVLFPSWMWHGTLPFRRGERLTVAFDVRPPI